MESDRNDFLVPLLITIMVIGFVFFAGNLIFGPPKYWLAADGLLMVVFSYLLIRCKIIGLYGLEGSLIGALIIITWGAIGHAEFSADYVIGFLAILLQMPINWLFIVLIVLVGIWARPASR